MSASTARQKTASTENFPVASYLLPASQRATIMAYYRFARQADDIADSPRLDSHQKVEMLASLEAVLMGERQPDERTENAFQLRHQLMLKGLDLALASDLIKAFTQDAIETRYPAWGSLLDYCKYSANPVGRFLLALNNIKNPFALRASDSLCTALQVLNHLQDCKDDFRELKRIYIPESDFEAADIPKESVSAPMALEPMRKVLNANLDRVDSLIGNAESLPALCPPTALAMQASITLECAKRLSALLRQKDPLLIRVEIDHKEKVFCAAKGFITFFRSRK